MNKKMVFFFVGQIIKIEAALLLLPLIVSLLYKEWLGALSFFLTALLALGIGMALTLFFRPSDRLIYAKEGFVIVALSWLGMLLIGALPFVISGAIPNYVDAFFETASGFTTTGASILRNVEALDKGALFWRSFTHWVGGMGVLVFVMAIIPTVCDRSMHVLKAEMPGPIVGKLVPKVRQTARILYFIYIGMTLIEVVLLLCGGMNLYESLVHAFGTAGTGGFGVKNNSIAGYSPYIQWVITAFMLLFGVNFNLFYLLLLRKIKTVFKSTELRVYLGIVFASIAIIAFNIYKIYGNLSETIRASSFQVASIITTTGFSTVDFNAWPDLSKAVLLLLMIIGACAGSTGGGLKVSRVVMLFRMIGNELRKLLHPRSVQSVRFEGKTLDEQTQRSVLIYCGIYAVVTVVTFLLISFEPFGLETNLSAVIACFNNIGPGFGAVGPTGNFADYTAFSKIILAAAMVFGRLEIYPMLFMLTPSTWFKK